MTNRRSQPLLQQAYLPLLVFSVAIAAFFCFLYITSSHNNSTQNLTPNNQTTSQTHPAYPKAESTYNPADNNSADNTENTPSNTQDNFLPSTTNLPSRQNTNINSSPSTQIISTPIHSSESRYEPTNLRLQHVVIADLGNGQLQKIVVEVPVLYESRLLRLNASQQTQTQNLFDRMVMLMEQSRRLQRETEETLIAWEMLVRDTSPDKILRADSPTLPREPIDPPLTPPTESALQTELSNP